MVKTNNVPRDILYWYELEDKHKFCLPYYEGIEDSSFFVYRNCVYDLGEFVRGGPAGWDGYCTESFFSAIVIRYVQDYERIVVGLHLAD